MLAGITLKKKPHVGAETGMGTGMGTERLPRQGVPIAVSVATCGFFPA